jgi:hypothetical protein
MNFINSRNDYHFLFHSFNIFGAIMKILTVLLLSIVSLFPMAGLTAPANQAKAPANQAKAPANQAKAPTELEQTLDLAVRTLAFVEKVEPRPALAAALADLKMQIEASGNVKPESTACLLCALKDLRRQIILSHPALNFDKLLINKNPPTLYSHNCDQYLGRHSRIGTGPAILENWKTEPKVTPLLQGKLPPGAYGRPDLAYDGKKFLFTYADHSEKNPTYRRFFLYEAAIDGSQVRQLTGNERDPQTTWMGRQTVPVEDGDPCYLPDGGIVFVSSRSQNFGRCHGGRFTPAFLLYRADGDGGNIRQLSYGEANEVEPSVLPDGRIVYTRWEYIDRHEMEFHKLWSTRPDGTAPANFYGNDTIYPLMIAQALNIPGTGKVVAIGMAHHSFNHGTVIVIDPAKGDNAPEAITRITPEVLFPESNECKFNTNGAFSDPYPITENLFFVAYSPHNVTNQGKTPPASGFGIYLIDTLGGRELIYEDPDTCSFSPIPIRPRPVPEVLASSLPTNPVAATGTYLIQNVNLTRNDPQGVVKPGDIKFLRFNELYNKPAASSARLSSPVPNALPKRIIGTVPVKPDGSVSVIVPAGIPIHIQALDANGMAIMTERSFHYLHAGEVRGCVGCHEHSQSTPQASALTSSRQAQQLTPPAGPRYDGGLSFPRTVQPVLDRYCIGCHGLKDKPAHKISLIGLKEGEYTSSYLRLVGYTKTIGSKGSSHGEEKNISRPKDYYAHGGRLGPMLLANHQKVNLDKESFARLIDWLDLNAQCYGDYSFNRIEDRRADAAGEKALRDYILARFGEALSTQPYAALVNVAQPDESRILMAPLATAAGGWGQITAGGWATREDPDFQKARQLVDASIAPMQVHDIAGTCGNPQRCRCGSCWVRLL